MNSKVIKICYIQALLLLKMVCSDIFFLKSKRFTVKEPKRWSRAYSDLMCVVKCIDFTRCQGASFFNDTCVIGEILPVRTNILPSQKQFIWIQKSAYDMYDEDGYLITDAPKTSTTLKTTLGTTTLHKVPKQVVKCPPNYAYIEEASGCFMVSRTTYTYDRAQKECEKVPGGYLAVLADPKKRKAVKTNIEDELASAIGSYVRVGGRQKGQGLEFVWEDGQVWSWGNPKSWCSYYHPATPLDCACFYFPGECIMSGSCSAYQAFICEVPV